MIRKTSLEILFASVSPQPSSPKVQGANQKQRRAKALQRLNDETQIPPFSAFAILAHHGRAAEPQRPNIIFILSDDHGYTDLGIHGIDPTVQTPAMDQLAAGGALMKFGYSTAPQCVPSRAGLMTGRVQNTFGLRGIQRGAAKP